MKLVPIFATVVLMVSCNSDTRKTGEAGTSAAPPQSEAVPETISAADLKARLDSGAPTYILDVREPTEWRSSPEGFIAGAHGLPMNSAIESAAGLKFPEGALVVTVCASGFRSADVAAELRKQNVKVSSLEGGMGAWAAAGYPHTSDMSIMDVLPVSGS